MKTVKKYLPLILILVSATLLRIYKIGTNYYFSGELGKELLYIRQFAQSHTIPLIGMGTSHEWLSYGPIYYWIMLPIFNIAHGNPFILFWVSLVVSLAGLIVGYFVFKRIFDERITLAITFITAFSPFLILQTRLSKLHTFFFLIMPIITYLTYLLWNGKKKWIVPTGLLFGVLFSFHFSQIPLLGVIALIFIIKRNIYKIKDWLLFGLGVIIPNITFLWQDKSLILWLPYRVANIANKNPIETIKLLNEYFGKSFFWDSHLWIVGSILFFAIFIYYVIKNKHKFTKEFIPFYIISSISLMLLANILHGTPPIHYFLPIVTAQTILVAIFLSKVKFWPLVVASVVVVNIFSFQNDPVFYKNFTGLVKNTDMVSYSTQNVISDFIVASSNQKPVSIKRIGAFDYFPENYSQNYKYLVAWKGGQVIDSSTNVYTITEDSAKGEVSVKK